MKNVTFDEWTGGARESEIAEMKKCVSKKRTKYLICYLVTWAAFFAVFLLSGLIPVVGTYIHYASLGALAIFAGLFMGLFIFASNTVAFVNSRGRNTGSGFMRTICLILGFIIIPIIVVQLCSRSDNLGHKICGIK